MDCFCDLDGHVHARDIVGTLFLFMARCNKCGMIYNRSRRFSLLPVPDWVHDTSYADVLYCCNRL